MAGSPGSSGAVVVVEDSFLLVKPDAAKYHREILAAIREAGLQVAMKSLKGLTRSQAELVVSQYKHIQQMFHAEHIARLERDGAFVNGLKAQGLEQSGGIGGGLGTPRAPTAPKAIGLRNMSSGSGGGVGKGQSDITGQIMRLVKKEDAAQQSSSTPRGQSSVSSAPFISSIGSRTPAPPVGGARSTSLVVTNAQMSGSNESMTNGSGNGGIDFNAMRPATEDKDTVPFSFPKRLDAYQSPLAVLQNMANDGALGNTLNAGNGSVNSNTALMRALAGGTNNTFTANWLRSPSRRPSHPSSSNAVTLTAFRTIPSASNLFNFSATSYNGLKNGSGGHSPTQPSLGGPVGGLTNFQATIFSGLGSPTTIAGAVLTTAPPTNDSSLFRRLHNSQALSEGKVDGQWSPAEFAFEQCVEYLVSGGTCLAMVLSGPRAVARTCELVGRYPTRRECLAYAPHSLRAQFACGAGGHGAVIKEGEAVLYNGFFCPEAFSEAAALVKEVFGYESTQRSEILRTAASTKSKRSRGGAEDGGHFTTDGAGGRTPTLPSLGTRGVASLGMSTSKLREMRPFLDALDVDDDKYIGKLLNYFDSEVQQLRSAQSGSGNNAASGNTFDSNSNIRKSQTLSIADHSRTARPPMGDKPRPPALASPRPHPRGGRPNASSNRRDSRLSVTTDSEDGDAAAHHHRHRHHSTSSSEGSSSGDEGSSDDDGSSDEDGSSDGNDTEHDGSGPTVIRSRGSGLGTMGRVWEKLDRKTQPATLGVGPNGQSGAATAGGNRISSTSSAFYPPSSRNASVTSDRNSGGGGDYSRYSTATESRDQALQRQQTVINQIVGLLTEERRSVQLETRRLRVNELELLLRERRLVDATRQVTAQSTSHQASASNTYALPLTPRRRLTSSD